MVPLRRIISWDQAVEKKKKYREKELSQPVIPRLNIIDVH
jgi:hypothetical protein